MKNKHFITVLLMLLSISLGAQETKGALKVDAKGEYWLKITLLEVMGIHMIHYQWELF